MFRFAALMFAALLGVFFLFADAQAGGGFLNLSIGRNRGVQRVVVPRQRVVVQKQRFVQPIYGRQQLIVQPQKVYGFQQRVVVPQYQQQIVVPQYQQFQSFGSYGGLGLGIGTGCGSALVY